MSLTLATYSMLSGAPLNALDFGADPTGVADTAPVLTAMLAVTKPGIPGRKARLHFPSGTYKFDSVVTDSTDYGAVIEGDGPEQTFFTTPNADASILNLQTIGSEVKNIGFSATNVAIATGDMIKFQGGNQKLQGKVFNVKIYSCYRGVTILGLSNSAVTGQYEIADLIVQSYAQSALKLQYANDVQVTRFTFDCGSTTDGTLGGIRLEGNVQACTFSQGSILTGKYGMTTNGTTTINERPSFCRFNEVFFDSSTDGVLIAYALDFDFTDCWASNRPGPGYLIQNSSGIKFHGGGANGCGTYGVLVESSSSNTTLNGFSASNNSQSSANTYHGIALAADISDFAITNCIAKNFMGLSGTQGYGIYVAAGTSDRYVVQGNLVTGNGTGGVSDNGTGLNKLVANNY